MANNISREEWLVSDTRIASEDIAAGTGVVLDSDGKAEYGSAGGAIYGIAGRAAKTGEAFPVVQLGLTPVIVATAGSLSAADKVMVQANTGKFITATSTNTSQASIAPGSPDVGANGDRANVWVNVFNPETIPGG